MQKSACTREYQAATISVQSDTMQKIKSAEVCLSPKLRNTKVPTEKCRQGSLLHLPIRKFPKHAPPCPTPSSAPSAIPRTQHQSLHPSPIFAPNNNQVNNVNVARAVYYISPLGSSQKHAPPPCPMPSSASSAIPRTQHQSLHPISTKSIM